MTMEQFLYQKMLRLEEENELLKQKIHNMMDCECNCENNVDYSHYKDKDNNIYFAFDLSGVSKERIDVVKKDNSILITVKGGTFVSDDYEFDVRLTYLPFINNDEEIAEIELSDDYEKDPSSVTYENGLLTLQFKQKEESKPKKIEIK